MPRWKALPDGLDPEARDLAEQLRRIVDRSGLDLDAIADRTDYARTSWERCLNGRNLAPKDAIVALAEVTGTDSARLVSLWELADQIRRHDEEPLDQVTEELHIPRSGPGKAAGHEPVGDGHGSSGDRDRDRAGDEDGPRGGDEDRSRGENRDRSGGGGARPGTSKPSWNAVLGDQGPLTTPQGPYPAPGQGAPRAGGTAPGAPAGPGTRTAHGSPEGPGLPAGQGTRSPGGSRPGRGPKKARASRSVPGESGGQGAPSGGGHRPARPGPPSPPAGSGGSEGGKRRIIMFLSGVVGALVVIGAAVFLTELGGSGGDKTQPVARTPPPAPTTTAPVPPPGVKCTGDTCAGQDPEAMGCGGEFARTVSRATVGTARVEVRFSQVCQAAWARITKAAPGDSVRISVGGKGLQKGLVNADSDAYTPMTPSKKGTDAKACATLASGATACTAVEP
ncbi:DUF2690 domain-containing protein [Streptomyces sp. NPDC051018]|uniref:helix-turn-helix domain-containing protein n=1 Tax=Streptomyces sp. NPDC051018 TaxID=3365639 RepID=UPI0037A4F82C